MFFFIVFFICFTFLVNINLTPNFCVSTSARQCCKARRGNWKTGTRYTKQQLLICFWRMFPRLGCERRYRNSPLTRDRESVARGPQDYIPRKPNPRLATTTGSALQCTYWRATRHGRRESCRRIHSPPRPLSLRESVSQDHNDMTLQYAMSWLLGYKLTFLTNSSDYSFWFILVKFKDMFWSIRLLR